MIKLRDLWAPLVFGLAATTLLSFGIRQPNRTYSPKMPPFFKIGHRGTRGLMPENTIPAMIKAVQLGCNTLEMDIHITKDGQVLVYHDDSFNPDYTLMPDGSAITDRKNFIFYQMDYARIRQFIIGTKKYPAFAQQQQVATYTPLLTELIDSVETYTRKNKLPGVNYLIEIKSDAKTDGVNQPAPEVVVDKLMAVLNPLKLGSRLIVQSFDVRPLKVLHQKYPKIALGFLTGDNKVSMAQNLGNLGFNPQFYNPHYGMVNAQMIDTCRQKGMLIAPWTVNDPAEMKRLKDLKVNGIITDYPNLFAGLLN